MVRATENQIKSIGSVLNDPSRPLKERFRALFTLRALGGPFAIECISQCFGDESVLLKHELAYCLGQMGDERANNVLIKVLEDVGGQEGMVRHEAAEALGAIGTPSNLEILEKFLQDSTVEVAQTCQLALERIKFQQNPDNNNPSSPTTTTTSINPYNSIDPAPPSLNKNVAELRAVLLDERASLFERYKSMFSLRNLGSKEAVEALGEGLKCEGGSGALFKHEIAFVLGQLQDVHGVPFLKNSLENELENEMVRHECAEALGAIANEECVGILKKYLKDEKRVVRESCEVALDMCEYENTPEFQYANAL